MKTGNPTAVYAVASTGVELAGRIASGLGADLYLPRRLIDQAGPAFGFNRLAEALQQNFRSYQGHVVVAAAGIVVRALAPLIDKKDVDPAVVVLDPSGRWAVSLLSGHLGGANDLAEKTARITGGSAVITTATDSAGKPSLEMIARAAGLVVENLAALSRISLSVLEDRPVPVYDPHGRLRPFLEEWPSLFHFQADPAGLNPAEPVVRVGREAGSFPEAWLVLRPVDLVAGLGCNRGTSPGELEELLNQGLDRVSVAPASLYALATIEAKRDEPGLWALAEKLKLDLNFFTAEELAGVKAPNPSETVRKHMGVTSVCEAAAMLAARTDRLLMTKIKSRNATLALAEISCE